MTDFFGWYVWRIPKLNGNDGFAVASLGINFRLLCYFKYTTFARYWLLCGMGNSSCWIFLLVGNIVLSSAP